MTKMIDTKFFDFIGINIKESSKRIKDIEENCGIKSIFEYSEREIRSKYIEYLYKAYLQEVSDFPILQDVIRYSQDVSIYNKDIDTALYMLVGSWYSAWNLEIEVYEKLPFSIIYDNKRMYQTFWCNGFRAIFGNLNRRSLLSPIKNKTRLAKYSYLNMRKLEDEIKKTIADKNMQYKKMEENIDKLTSAERKMLKFNYFMSQDGIENLILFDWMFGLSFAEICYEHISKKQLQNMSYVERVIECLAEIKGCHIRNELADMVLQKYLSVEMSEEVFEQFMNGLEDIVKTINTVYSVSLLQVWEGFRRNAGDNVVEIWREIIIENTLGVYVPSYDIYSKKVYDDIRCEKKVMNIHRAENAIQMLDEIEEYLSFMGSVPEGLTEKQLKKVNRERRKESDVREESKEVKTKSDRYIKIQSAIIKRQIMGNFPTFFK